MENPVKKTIPIVTSNNDTQKARQKPPLRQMRGTTTLVTLVGEETVVKPYVVNPVVVNPVINSFNPVPAGIGFPGITAKEYIPVNQVDDTLSKIRSVALTSQYWHKFLIFRGAGYSKRDILHALTEAVSPLLINPVQFKQEGTAVSFLLKDCLPVIEKFLSCNFKIKVPYIGPLGVIVHYLHIELTLRFAHVEELQINPVSAFECAVFRRFDKTMRSLDLSSFLDDEELESVVLCPLWSPPAMIKALVFMRIYHKSIQIVNLADNDLDSIRFLTSFPNLRILDVSGNQLTAVDVLRPLYDLPITDLSLDRNPLCNSYSNEQAYISAVKNVAPRVRKLDGVFIPRLPSMPCWRPNYIPPEHSAECTSLVDQFLQHFFTLMDGDNRLRLRGMYHPDALFSLTYVVDSPGESAAVDARRMAPYSSESRNLLRISDYSKMQQLLSQGAEEVLATLNRLPETEHDPYSFAVDVPFFNLDAAMIVVRGVFREPTRWRDVHAFSRLFLLKRVGANEYQIANEMLSITRATSNLIAESFLHPKPKVSLAKLSFNPAQDLTNADRAQMTRILSRITEMNQNWARKCLEESKWDIKNALQVFTELLKMNKLPAEAFLSDEERALDRK